MCDRWFDLLPVIPLEIGAPIVVRWPSGGLQGALCTGLSGVRVLVGPEALPFEPAAVRAHLERPAGFALALRWLAHRVLPFAGPWPTDVIEITRSHLVGRTSAADVQRLAGLCRIAADASHEWDVWRSAILSLGEPVTGPELAFLLDRPRALGAFGPGFYSQPAVVRVGMVRAMLARGDT